MSAGKILAAWLLALEEEEAVPAVVASRMRTFPTPSPTPAPSPLRPAPESIPALRTLAAL